MVIVGFSQFFWNNHILQKKKKGKDIRGDIEKITKTRNKLR